MNEEAIQALRKTNNKQSHVQAMFSSAAKRYDFVNSLLSGRMHHRWKKKAIKYADVEPSDKALDVCSGTQDLALMLAEKMKNRGSITAVDLNAEMIKVGDKKVEKKGLKSMITSIVANAQDLPLTNNTYDLATVAFGIRNVDNIEKAFSEILRVLKPGGQVVCLEFSKPTSLVFKLFYEFYSLVFLPVLGRFFSGDKTGIYYYLPRSIKKFPPQEKLKKIMASIGFSKVRYVNLCGGIVAIHIGYK